MWIRNLGPPAVEAFGPARTFVLFNMSGAMGFLLSNEISGTPTIGASGAIFGLLAALIPHDHNGSEIASVMSQHAIHGVVARMGFSAIIALSIVVPALIRAETEWRRWRWFSYVVFTSTAVLGWLFQIDAWEGNRGLLQRGFFLTTMAWVFGTALKLRHGSSRVGRPRNLPRKS